MLERGTVKLIIIPLSVIFIGVLVFLIINIVQAKKANDMSIEVISCGDRTAFGECSNTKPYYCNKGILVEDTSKCECSGLSTLDSNGTCISKYESYPYERNLTYVVNGQEGKINFTLYGELADEITRISRFIDYAPGEQPSRADFKAKVINYNEQRELMMPLVVAIQNLKNDRTDQARVAVSLVQNIPYGASGSKVSFAGGEIDYSKYPYETIYYAQGVCGEKSTLMAFLLKELGYNVSILYFSTENHEAVGIKCPMKYSFQDTGYCFVETSGPAIISDSSIEYENGIKIESKPQIIPISDGASLPKDMYEYNDAKTLKQIRERSFFGIIKIHKFPTLKSRYGLIEEYKLE